jgi:hypothetical protein
MGVKLGLIPRGEDTGKTKGTSGLRVGNVIPILVYSNRGYDEKGM